MNRTLFYEELNKLQNKKANIIQSALDGRMSAIEAATKQRNAAREQSDGSDPFQNLIQKSRSSAPNNTTEEKNSYTLDTDSMRNSLEHVQAVREAAETAKRLAQQQAALQAQSQQQQTVLEEKGGSLLDGMNPTQRKDAASTAMSEYNKQAQAAAYIMSETSKYPSMHAEYEKAAADYKKATEQYELAKKEYAKATADEDAYKESDAYKEELRLAQTPIENASTVEELKHNLDIYNAKAEAAMAQLDSFYLLYDRKTYEAASQDYKTYSALQTQTQQKYNNAVDKEIEAHREEYLAQGYHAANFWDNTGLSVLRAYYESKYYKEMALEALGFENNADYWAEKLQDDKFKFFSDNYADQAVSGASGVVGQMGAELLSYETFFSTVAAVGFAVTAGNAGPGALLPEEVFTIPAALAYGINYGMAVTGAQIEMGMAYVEMIEAGVDRDTAVLISIGVGTVNGILESVQLDDVFKAFKVLDKTGLDNTFTKRLTQYLIDQGVHIAKETGQEVAQEMVTIAGVNAGKAASGLETDSLSDIGQRLKDTAVSSALTFGVLNAAGLSGRLAHTYESLNKLSDNQVNALYKSTVDQYAETLKSDGFNDIQIDSYLDEAMKTTGVENQKSAIVRLQEEMGNGNVLSDESEGGIIKSAQETVNELYEIIEKATAKEIDQVIEATSFSSIDGHQTSSIVKQLAASNTLTKQEKFDLQHRVYRKADDLTDVQIARDISFVDDDFRILWPLHDGYAVVDGKVDKQPFGLMKGMIFDRFGSADGRFVCLIENGKSVQYEQRGLPFEKNMQAYHKYEVVRDFSELADAIENCDDAILQSEIKAYMYQYGIDSFDSFIGKIAKVFNSEGEEMQIMIPIKVKYLIGLGFLIRI